MKLFLNYWKYELGPVWSWAKWPMCFFLYIVRSAPFFFREFDILYTVWLTLLYFQTGLAWEMWSSWKASRWSWLSVYSPWLQPITKKITHCLPNSWWKQRTYGLLILFTLKNQLVWNLLLCNIILIIAPYLTGKKYCITGN